MSVSFSSHSVVIEERSKNARKLESERVLSETTLPYVLTVYRKRKGQRDRERLMLMLSANLQLAAAVSGPLIDLQMPEQRANSHVHAHTETHVCSHAQVHMNVTSDFTGMRPFEAPNGPPRVRNNKLAAPSENDTSSYANT